MKLFEFFGKPLDIDKLMSRERDDRGIVDDVFWFIIDHDKIHKDYLIPLAKKIKQRHDAGSLDKEEIVSAFKPMVEKGCLEYYHKNKMQGKPGTIFPKDMRSELCEKLYDHFREDIVKDKYKLGQ